MRRLVVVLAYLAFALCFNPPTLRGQSTNASLTGRVLDPSKATVANAKVAAVNIGTNSRYKATTNEAGKYTLPNLPPAAYSIEVEKEGFKKLIQPGVMLHVQDALEINFELTLGSGAETITVEGGTPIVNTESATVSTVVDQAFVENLPLNGRSFQTLILLTPSTVVTQTAVDDQGQFSVNGQRADANYFTVDGVSANFGVTGFPPLVQAGGGALPAFNALGGTTSLVSADAMQEFRVQTSSFAPEFGRAPGGQISIVTRSGTNQFHGTAYEYFRNDTLDANDWFSDHNHLPKPEERQNDFGGVFGGPVFKDNTFFFFSYEGLRLRQPATEETAVPDAASRQQASTAMRPYLNAYPVANGAELSGGFAQFNAGFSDPSFLNAYSVRVDHVIDPRTTLFVRYNYSPSGTTQRGPSGAALSTTESLSSSVQTISAGITQSFEAGISNEIRANYSNDRVSSRYALDNFAGAVPPPDAVLFPPGFSSANSWFELLILGAGDYVQGKYGTDEQRQINFVDNLSIIRGSHLLKFGGDYRWLSPFSSPLAYGQFGEFSGLNTASGGALSGTAVVTESLALQSNALLAQNFSFYGQDTWRITPHLTMTYGLRWDIDAALKGKNAANDPFTVTGLNDPATLALAPHGTPLYQTTYGNVAPRVGLAYRLAGQRDWGAVLRASFGIFYDSSDGSLGGVSSYFPYEAVKLFAPSQFPLSSQDAAPPPFTVSPPIPTILVAEPDLKLSRTYEWNVAVEKSLGSSGSLALTYVGAAGRDLLRAVDLVNPNPNFGLVVDTGNTGNSDYNALEVKFQQHLSHGAQALGSYTFSHSIDNGSTDAFTFNSNTPANSATPNIDRGSSDFDIRHTFTAGITYAPSFHGVDKIVRGTLNGWSIDAFALTRSAPPVDLIGSVLPYSAVSLYLRPELIVGVPTVLHEAGYAGDKIFNAAAFSPAPAGQQGDFGRNVLRGFGAWQSDFALQRQFWVREQLDLRLRAEFFNIFNHPNFGPPDGNLTDALFGHSTQTLASSLGSGGANGGFSPLYQIGGPRSVQLALKLAF